MPTLHLYTNVPGDRVATSDLLKALSAAVTSAVGKPEKWVMCSVTTDKPMIYSGTEEPCAWAQLVSIGAVGGEKNKAISKAISGVLEAKLGVPASRFYLVISDVQASNHGWNGSTFG